MHDDRDEFYVGYLPTPPAHLQVVRVLVVLMAIWILVLAAVIAFFMRDPGSATWSFEEQTWTGTLVTEPYPMLLPDDGSAAYLVVEMGKLGAQERLDGLGNTAVSLTGFLLQRDGRRIIELTAGDLAIARLSDTVDEPPRLFPDHVENAAVRGEIVDGKCYLGAMKPGDGLTHKACATLCIRGGLPPMFVMQTPEGPELRLLIVDGRAALPEDLLPLVAEPVRIEGELIEIAGLPAVRVSAGDISLIP